MIMPKLQAVIKITLLGAKQRLQKKRKSLKLDSPLHVMEKAIILCSLSLGNEKNDDNFLWRLTHHFSTGAKLTPPTQVDAVRDCGNKHM